MINEQEQIKNMKEFIGHSQAELVTINEAIAQLYREHKSLSLYGCDPMDAAVEQLKAVQQAVQDASKAIAEIQDAIKEPDQTLVIVRDNGEQRKGKVIGTRTNGNTIEFKVEFPDEEVGWFNFIDCKAVI